MFYQNQTDQNQEDSFDQDRVYEYDGLRRDRSLKLFLTLVEDVLDLDLLADVLVDVCTALEDTFAACVCIALDVVSEERFMPCISSKVS